MSEFGDPFDDEQPDGLIPADDVDGWVPGGPVADELSDGEGDGASDRSTYDEWTAAARELASVAAFDELEQSLADEELEELGTAASLDRLAGTTTRVNAVLVDQLRLVAHWADLHGHVADCPVPGAERLVCLGGDGTPEIAEFAVAELGVALRASTAFASRLLSDALDLRHRLPLLWQHTIAGTVPVSIARRVAEEARPLTAAAAASVDRRIASLAGGLTWRRLSAIVRAAVLAADPERAKDAAERASAGAGVWLDDEATLADGYGTLFARASAGDLAAFNSALAVVANALGVLGDTDSLQQRRSKALGILALPQQALELVKRAQEVRDQPTSPGVAAEAPAFTSRRLHLDFKHTLYFHLSREAVEAMLHGRSGGVGRMEGVGPVIAEQIRQWLGHSSVIVKPVIDPDTMTAVDCWEVLPRMSEAVQLRRPADYFPWSTCTSRHQDNEHPDPYVPIDRGGPPGQTSVRTLAKITRFHHRVKTFGGWTVTGVKTDTWLWRSPHGHYSLVDPGGTTNLGRLT